MCILLTDSFLTLRSAAPRSASFRCGSTHLSGLIPGVAQPALPHDRSVLRRPVLPGRLRCRRNRCCGLCEVRKECCPTRTQLLPPGLRAQSLATKSVRVLLGRPKESAPSLGWRLCVRRPCECPSPGLSCIAASSRGSARQGRSP